jgi:serine phosphatase RsbU (regulator of sigma subunit)
LQRHLKSSSRDLCEAAILDITNYQNNNLADDVTLLALRRSAAAGSVNLPADLLKAKS